MAMLSATLMSSLTGPWSIRMTVVYFIITAILFGYVVYQRYFHPLAKFPGPFLASLTDLWQVNQFIRGQQPYILAELHTKYGSIVRYGPNKLSVISEDAVTLVYVKNAKVMPKTEYYHSFGRPGRPNIFNTTDVEDHAARRRHLLKIFSPKAVETYEPLLDEKIQELRLKISEYAQTTPTMPFDLKDLLWSFMCDVITLVVYGDSWELLKRSESHGPLDIHAVSLWGAVSGAWSAGEPIMKFLVLLVPHTWTFKVSWQNIFHAIGLEKKIKARQAEIANSVEVERRDILTKLILESSASGTKGAGSPDIAIECLGFLSIAGVHPPAAALTVLFYHLLHSPPALREATKETRESLPPKVSAGDVYSCSTIEQSLPYLRRCLTESFRITPVFTMPLPRRVTQKEGIIIDDCLIPKGTTVAVSNHAFHHNHKIWPGDLDTFDPSRWNSNEERMIELKRLMMHFGAGNRQCIGKVLATTIIYKVSANLLSEFDFELANPLEQQKAEKGDFSGIMPRMTSVGISELDGPLWVRASLRT